MKIIIQVFIDIPKKYIYLDNLFLKTLLFVSLILSKFGVKFTRVKLIGWQILILFCRF
jgi:hypothetical protein